MSNIKYLKDGQKVSLVETLSTGYVVNFIYDDGEEEYIDDEPEVVKKIFDEPPIYKYHQQIAELQKTISELEQNADKLQREIFDYKNTKAEQLHKYKKYDQLKQLDDFLDGKLTHYVVLNSYRPKIIDAKEANDEYDHMPKLLSLFGKSNGDIAWRLNDYRDGSGSWHQVIPCASYDDAIAKLQDYLLSLTDKDYIDDGTIEAAKRYNLKISDEIKDKYKKEKIKNLQSSFKSYQDRANEYKKMIDNLLEAQG